MLDPRWENISYEDRDGKKKVSRADVRIVRSARGPEVDNNGKGKVTSLHDGSGWYPTCEFVIPAGTNSSDEILIDKDADVKTNPKSTSAAPTAC